jgi:hypothetical protein
VTTAHWSVCGPAGCSSGTRETSAEGGTLPVRTDVAGTYVVRVSLQDAAGNHDPARHASWTLTREVPVPPSAAPAPRPAAPHAAPAQRTSAHLRLIRAPALGADGRTVVVRGTAAAAATGVVDVVLSARVGGRLRRVERRTTIRDRRFVARLSLPAGRWSRATVRIRYAGNRHVRASMLTTEVRRPTSGRRRGRSG